MSEYHELLILKFLQRTISPNEQVELDAWIDQSPDNQRTFDELQQVWILGEDKTVVPDFQSGDEWKRLEASLKKANETSVRKLQTIYPYWVKVAASVSVLAICAFIVYLMFINPEKITVESAATIKEFTLPDGSVVWLNKESKITYEKDFDDERIVNLEGEAFFDVKKNPEKPFVIHTAYSQVEVLGTSFDVRSYRNDDHTEVFVVTGVVRFSNKANTSAIELKKGESGTLGRSEDQVVRGPSEEGNALAWKEKRLIFKKTQLKDVVLALQNYFDIKISVNNDRLLRCRFTSSFEKPALKEVMEALSVSLDMDVVYQDSAYVFSGEGCKE